MGVADELDIVGSPRDFAINRRRLVTTVPHGPPPLVDAGSERCILELSSDVLRGYIRQLLGRAPSEFASGRVPLYICGQCGSLDCGALTVRVTRVDDRVVWSELSTESPSEGGAPATWLGGDPRDFYFDAAAYDRVLASYG